MSDNKDLFKMPYSAKDDTFIVDCNDLPVLSIENIGKVKFSPAENGKAGYEYNPDARWFLEFTADALNKAAEKFLEIKLTWKKTIADLWYDCPKCGFSKEFTPSAGFYNHCPNCGQFLYPPGGKEKL
jgi:rubrerythrin